MADKKQAKWDDAFKDLYVEYLALKRNRDAIDAKIEKIKDTMIEWIGDDDEVVDNNGNKLAIYTRTTQKRFDSKAFKEDNAEMYDKYVKEIKVNMLKVNVPKEN